MSLLVGGLDVLERAIGYLIPSNEIHPSFLPPMFCEACEDSGQELDGTLCRDCGGESYPQRLAHERALKLAGDKS